MDNLLVFSVWRNRLGDSFRAGLEIHPSTTPNRDGRPIAAWNTLGRRSAANADSCLGPFRER